MSGSERAGASYTIHLSYSLLAVIAICPDFLSPVKELYHTEKLVVATGPFHTPYLPPIVADLSDEV